MDWNPATGCQRLNICQEASIEATERKQRFESLVDIGSVTQSLCPDGLSWGPGFLCCVCCRNVDRSCGPCWLKLKRNLRDLTGPYGHGLISFQARALAVSVSVPGGNASNANLPSPFVLDFGHIAFLLHSKEGTPDTKEDSHCNDVSDWV